MKKQAFFTLLMLLALALGACGETDGRSQTGASVTATPAVGTSTLMAETPTTVTETPMQEVTDTPGLDASPETTPTTEAAAPGAYWSVADVTGAPEAAMQAGRVVVVGEVDTVFGAGLFKLDEEAPFRAGIDNDLLVLVRTSTGLTETDQLTGTSGLTDTDHMTESVDPLDPNRTAVAADPTTTRAMTGTAMMTDTVAIAIDNKLVDDWVVVTGTVSMLVIAEIERELGLDLDPEIEAEFASRPILIADAVSRYAPDPAVTPTATPDDAADNAADGLSVAEITGNLSAYDGQTVTVVGEVEEILAGGIFKLDDEALFAGGIDNDLLVMTTTQTPVDVALLVDEQLEGAEVRVTGTVRLGRDVTFEEQGADLEEDFHEEWENRAVLEATSIERIDE